MMQDLRDDLVRRGDVMDELVKEYIKRWQEGGLKLAWIEKAVDSARPVCRQSTLYGYNIEHLELIARVLQKENLPPERIVEALTDIGRIVAIITDEFEGMLRKAVANCGARMENE